MALFSAVTFVVRHAAGSADFVNSALTFPGLEPHGRLIDQPVNNGFNLVWEGDVLTLPSTVELGTGQVPPLRTRVELVQANAERTARITGLDLSARADFPERALGSAPD
jgi:hypothetical protein